MPKNKETLSSLFAPPEHLYGIGAALCAFSADASFIEQALFRFSRVHFASRRTRGSVDFTLMLDPSHEIFSQDLVPGLLQLRPRAAEKRPWKFHCMHAKVALLAFGPARMGEPTQYRVIVSTGNWTIQSARHQIEMVWYLDIHSQSSEEDRWELYNVADFLQKLLGCYQVCDTMKVNGLIRRALTYGKNPETNGKTRFISTLEQPFIDQLTSRLEENKTRGCDYLVCGSGFFEQKFDPQEQPEVLKQLVTRFQKKGILTKSPPIEKRIVTNGDIDDQVMASFKSGVLGDWTLCHPNDPVSDDPTKPREKLHAKFIFIAKSTNKSFSNNWLYLGSGNLSQPGMLQGFPNGNIEAGVILQVPELSTAVKLSRNLPIGKKFTNSELQTVDTTESKATPRPEEQPPAPIILFHILQDGLLSIVWDLEVTINGDLQIVLPNGDIQLLQPMQQTLKLPQTDWPRSLEILWNGHSCNIPCIDTHGDFMRQVIKNPSFGNCLDQIMGFPETLHDPKVDADDAENDIDSSPNVLSPALYTKWDIPSGGREFPAHTAMMLVETIADHNGMVSEQQSTDWICYLKNILIEDCPKSHIESWQTLKINFLAALLSTEGFAPDWNDLSKYRELITQVAKEWHLDKFEPLELKL